MPTATPITALINSGMDAFANLYDVYVMTPEGLTDDYDGSKFSIRATDFTPPELTFGTTSVDYKIIQITRPNSTIDGERKFQITFRMDANYALYKALLNWKKKFVDPTGEGSMNFGSLSGGDTTNELVDADYGTVYVDAYKASTNSGAIAPATSYGAVRWTFSHVLCTKVGTPTFTRDGSDAVMVTAEFIFGTYELAF